MKQASSIGSSPPPRDGVVQENFRGVLRITAASWGLDVPAHRSVRPLAPALHAVLRLPRRRAWVPGF